MGHSLNNSTPRMSRFISNEEIRQIYVDNQNSPSKEWMNLVFNKTRFFILKKIEKNFYLKSDLKQEALFALWSAIITFAFNKNFDFFRWADWHIKSKIRDHISGERRYLNTKNSIKIYHLGTHISEANDFAFRNIDAKIDLNNWLRKNKKNLSRRDSKIIVETIFMHKSLAEVAAANEISKERVRQIKAENLQKIKEYMNK